jgi:lipopolysaccharide transport system ATP-binding protein
MLSKPYAVRVSDVSKRYEIYDKPSDRLWQSVFRRRRQFYKEFWALRNISLDIKQGETFGIIGKNGSGKSTLLQIICGTLRPTSGHVACAGKVAALLELGAGFNPEFTGRENAILNGTILGLSAEQIEERLPSIIEFAEIGDFIDRPVKTYSSGMFVRLAFAVIAHVDAEVLIIDEALAVGDAQFTQKCMRFLRDFKQRGTLIFVSHDTSSILNLCERAIWLDRGELQAVGDAKSVTEQYLASLFNQRQKDQRSVPEYNQRFVPAREWKDQRLSLINQSTLRNDLEIFQFKPGSNAFFGDGGIELLSIVLEDEAGSPLSWAVGGEFVQLRVTARSSVELDQPIAGFYLKDKLGQTLFGDNTYLSRSPGLTVKPGQCLSATFAFPMPTLPVGDYSFDVAIANGTQERHTQHYWGHDVLLIRSVSSSAATGLIGIPMLNIELDVCDP